MTAVLSVLIRSFRRTLGADSHLVERGRDGTQDVPKQTFGSLERSSTRPSFETAAHSGLHAPEELFYLPRVELYPPILGVARDREPPTDGRGAVHMVNISRTCCPAHANGASFKQPIVSKRGNSRLYYADAIYRGKPRLYREVIPTIILRPV